MDHLVFTMSNEYIRKEVENADPPHFHIAGVRSCYDEGKRVAETLMFDYHRQHGIGSHSFFFFEAVVASLLLATTLCISN